VDAGQGRGPELRQERVIAANHRDLVRHADPVRVIGVDDVEAVGVGAGPLEHHRRSLRARGWNDHAGLQAAVAEIGAALAVGGSGT
jgi:hypothetical protein